MGNKIERILWRWMHASQVKLLFVTDGSCCDNGCGESTKV